MPYLYQTTNFVVSHSSQDLAKCNINTTQCITPADSVLGNRGATSGKKNSKLKLIPVQRHFLIISCSYALNLAPAAAGFATINPAPVGFAKTKSGTALVLIYFIISDSTWISLIGCDICLFFVLTRGFPGFSNICKKNFVEQMHYVLTCTSSVSM